MHFDRWLSGTGFLGNMHGRDLANLVHVCELHLNYQQLINPLKRP